MLIQTTVPVAYLQVRNKFKTDEEMKKACVEVSNSFKSITNDYIQKLDVLFQDDPAMAALLGISVVLKTTVIGQQSGGAIMGDSALVKSSLKAVKFQIKQEKVCNTKK